MSEFFKTSEFRFLKKLQERLELIHTEKNFKTYQKYLGLCTDLAQKKFNNIGWREDIQRYAWDKLDVNNIGPPLFDCGDDKNGMSFYPGANLYMSEDQMVWVLKHSDGTIVKYTPEETNELRESSLDELIKIHDAKKITDGRIIGGEEKREFDSEWDKETVK